MLVTWSRWGWGEGARLLARTSFARSCGRSIDFGRGTAFPVPLPRHGKCSCSQRRSFEWWGTVPHSPKDGTITCQRPCFQEMPLLSDTFQEWQSGKRKATVSSRSEAQRSAPRLLDADAWLLARPFGPRADMFLPSGGIARRSFTRETLAFWGPHPVFVVSWTESSGTSKSAGCAISVLGPDLLRPRILRSDSEHSPGASPVRPARGRRRG